MKKLYILIFLLIPFLNKAQTQIGNTLNGYFNSAFGNSVSLSSDGSIVAVGAYIDNNEGSVRIYKNQSGVWTQIGNRLHGFFASSPGDNTGPMPNFGNSVSLSSDGSIVAVGAKADRYTGFVYIYQNQNDIWTQITNLSSSSLSGYFGHFENFGQSVSLSSGGNIVAIGAIGENLGIGSVYIYQNQSGVWTQIGNTINGLNTGDSFGISVSLSSDGSIVAVGAHKEFSNTGTVRIYQNQSGVWTQIGNTINGLNTGDSFGISVSLSSDGSIVAVVAINENTTNGVIRIYKNQSSIWTQIGGTLNGKSVSLSSDGSKVVIGDFSENSYRGTIRIYQNQSGVWTQIGNIINGLNTGDSFGISVSLSSDGSIVAVGSEGFNNPTGYTSIYNISSVLSISEPIVNANFSIYPNPIKDHFTVKLNNTYTLQKLSVYNILGQQVLEQSTNKVVTSKLSKGLYYVKVETNKGIGVKKVIIE